MWALLLQCEPLVLRLLQLWTVPDDRAGSWAEILLLSICTLLSLDINTLLHALRVSVETTVQYVLKLNLGVPNSVIAQRADQLIYVR